MFITAVLGVVALVLGALALALGLWTAFTLWYALRSSAWRTVSGTVTESRVVSNRSANGMPGWHYAVRYSFRLEGREYRGTRVRFGDFRYFTRRDAEAIASRFEPGAAVTVHVDAAFKHERIGDDERQPISALEPGLNRECLYPATLFLATSNVALTSLLAAIARLRG